MDNKASSIMNIAVISVDSRATLEEVVKILADNKISGLPVVDSEKKVVGIITETDIVDFAAKLHVVPLIGTAGWISPYMDVTEMTKFKQGFTLLANTKVEKAMSKRIVTALEEMPVHKIAGLMKKKDVNRVPIVDGDGKIVGIIARADLVNYLAAKS